MAFFEIYRVGASARLHVVHLARDVRAHVPPWGRMRAAGADTPRPSRHVQVPVAVLAAARRGDDQVVAFEVMLDRRLQGTGSNWAISACIVGDLLAEPLLGELRPVRGYLLAPRRVDIDTGHQVTAYPRGMDSRVARYRRKPVPDRVEEIAVAKYVPGEPLSALGEVARMADPDAELGEVQLPSGPVLLVGWRCESEYRSDGEQEWEVLRAGEYLEFSPRGHYLGVTDDHELTRLYEAVTGQAG